MSSRKQGKSLLVCLAGFLAASVGFLLSVLATIFTKFTARSSGRLIIKNRDAAVIASTPSPSEQSSQDSFSTNSSSTKSTPPLLSSTRRETKAEPLSGVEGRAKDARRGESLSPPQVSLSPAEQVTSPATPPRPHIVHFQTPTEEIPTISISPPPTRLSHQSESSHASTDINTLASTASVDEAPTLPERRGRRLRFSKMVHLFGDKRANSRLSRQASLPALADDLPLSPPLTLSPVPLTPSLPSAVPPSPRSRPINQRKSRPRSLILRTASCPILRHHSQRHGHTRSLSTDEAAVPPLRLVPGSPSSKKPKAEKKKEVVPRPRTHPYEAPYFIPPPDSEDVEEPLARRRPSRRRTTPPERPMSGPDSSVAAWSIEV
ncbi:hypothetical protein DFH06DRAFT_219569 [Mycena polygramma]|nr:hypothetical protein DFH06DRAFT_219569 [Mycena polygramma]